MLRLLICTLLAVGVFGSPAKINPSRNTRWFLYKKTFNKMYEAEEELSRREIFEEHLDLIEKHNAEFHEGKHTYTLGLNKYADMTNQEFVKQMNGYRMDLKKPAENVFMPSPNVQLPTTVDWRTKGYVTGVKDQKQCGSCWAFSATGSLEGQHFNKTGNLVSLSEQNLMDCSWKEGNMGCDGGLMDQAFTYIRKNNGIDTEVSYPYTAKDGKCHFMRQNVGATDIGFHDIMTGSEKDLQGAVAAVGPISVAIDASHTSFQLYSSGIYNEPECSSTQLDHGVLAVGYGSHTNMDYWLVKNSWGLDWGMQGYIMMSRNKDNQCGIATAASYPRV